MCGETKSINEFYSQKKYSENKGNWIYYNPECKECTKEKTGKWRKENPERLREITNNQSKRRIRKITDRDRKYRKEYRRNNKDKMRKYNEDRKHKKHDITDEEWRNCKRYFKSRCAYCGMMEHTHRKLYNQQLHKEHVDHVGGNDLSNCVPSCKNCNSQKWTYEFEDWYNPDNKIFKEDRFDKIIKWLTTDHKQFMNTKRNQKVVNSVDMEIFNR